MFKSVRSKLYTIFMAMLGSLIALAFVFNLFFLPEYYVYRIEKSMKRNFLNVASLINNAETGVSDGTGLSEKFATIESTSGCRVYVLSVLLGQDGKTILSSATIYGSRLPDIFGMSEEDMIKSRRPGFSENEIPEYLGSNISIDVYEAGGSSTKYMAISGMMDMTDAPSSKILIMLETTIEAINNSVHIANTFLLYTGLIIAVIGCAGLFLVSSSFVKPIVEISDLTQKMSVLDFSDKIDVKTSDEIGRLGESINVMSQKLETAVHNLKEANNKLKVDIINREKTDEMRKEFMSNVSHELKTPLSLIIGYAEGLKVGISEEDRDFYCDVIIDEGQKMNKMVSRLLYVSRLESSAMKPVIESFSIIELLNSCLESFKLQFQEKNIFIEKVYNFTGQVSGDIDQIGQVVTNYISNAVNHCAGEKRITIITEKTGDGYLRVGVYNTGEHIPPESLPQVWESFYKVDPARTREYGGTGLGLYIVKSVVESHGGRYSAENVKDGVLFSFELKI